MTRLRAFLAMAFICSNCYAGTEIGNGGDVFGVEHHLSWFLGHNRVVKACIVQAPDFGYPKGAFAVILKRSYQRWIDYIDERKVLGKDEIADPDGGFARSLEIAPECRGTEDLRIELGTKRTNEPGLDSPAAFVKRTSISLSKRWAKGLLWIKSKGPDLNYKEAPNWSAPGFLEAILMHELGHIFGCPHVAATIMAENIVELLAGNASWLASHPELAGTRGYTNLLKNITSLDFGTDLIPRALPREFEFGGTHRYFDFDPTALGEPPGQGPGSCTLNAHEQIAGMGFDFKCRTSYQEYSGTFTPLDIGAQMDSSAGVKIFLRPFLMPAGAAVAGFNIAAPRYITFGTLKLSTGKTFPAILDRNDSDILTLTWFSLSVIQENIRLDLFAGLR